MDAVLDLELLGGSHSATQPAGVAGCGGSWTLNMACVHLLQLLWSCSILSHIITDFVLYIHSSTATHLVGFRIVKGSFITQPHHLRRLNGFCLVLFGFALYMLFVVLLDLL